MVTLAQLRSESASERVRRIWGGIVRFANADADMAVEDFIKLLARCSYSSNKDIEKPLTVGSLRMGLAEEMVEEIATEVETNMRKLANPDPGNITWFLRTFEELKLCADNEGLIPFEALKSLAVKYQKDFKGLATWLCVPTDYELARAAVQFLQGNLRHTPPKLTPNMCRPLTMIRNWTLEDLSIEGVHPNAPPFFYWRSDDYYSIMSPICEFIFTRIERYHAGELSLSEAVPIQVCKRADCGKFILPERSGKRYCSGGCRAQAFQKRAGVAWATYMREYRKGKKVERKRRRKR